MIKGSENYIAIDTEFVREKGVYYPIPCLVQISRDGKNAMLYDPLHEGTDWSLVVELLKDTNTTKVFHSLKQDLDVIYKLFALAPQNVFDIQIAAMFLPDYEMPSYDLLVKDFLGQNLDKSLQYSDWKSRPISEDKLSYAAKDVTYLYQLYPKVIGQLGVIKKAWVDEEMIEIIHSHYDIQKQIDQKVESILLETLMKRREIVNEGFAQYLISIVKWLYAYSISNNRMPSSLLENAAIQGIAHGISTSAELPKSKINDMLLKHFEEDKLVHKSSATSLIEECIRKKHIIFQKPKIYSNVKKLLLKCSQEVGVHQLIVAKKHHILNSIMRKRLCKKLSAGWRYEIFGCHFEKLL